MTDVVQRANVGMIERRNGTGFAIEALFRLRALRKMLRKNLYRDGPIKSRVQRAIHFAHPTRAERSLNLIRAEFRAGERDICGLNYKRSGRCLYPRSLRFFLRLLRLKSWHWISNALS